MTADVLPFRRRDDDPTDRGVTPRDRLDHDMTCVDGWLDGPDRPRPCPRCRPHLTRSTNRAGMTAWRAAPTRRSPR